MKKPFLNYIQVASDMRDAPMVVRGRVLAIAIGMSLGCQLPLPSSEVADPAEYYATHVERPVASIVSSFNEQTILDVKYAAIMAKNFWMQRYDVAHRCPRLGMTSDFFASLYSISAYFSVNEVELMNEQHYNIANVYNVCCPLVRELLKTAA